MKKIASVGGLKIDVEFKGVHVKYVIDQEGKLHEVTSPSDTTFIVNVMPIQSLFLV